MELDVLNHSGSATGRKAVLADDIYSVEPHTHAMWQSITTYLANQRQGTHSTKTRGMIAGSTKKLFRQKGTGRARQGDIKSGLHPGGGAIHGPMPHKYTKSLPRKVRQLARKSALSEKMAGGALMVVQDLNLTAAKTKPLQQILNALKVDKTQVLLLTSGDSVNTYVSGRNIPTLTILAADKASMYDIWKARCVVIEESAVAIMDAGFRGGVEQPEVSHIALTV